MEKASETLSGIELFKSLPAPDIAALVKRCQWRRYGAGQEIVGHLDDTKDVYFIVTGAVRVTVFSLSGKEVAFRDMRVGESFGELAAIDGGPRSANVAALADSLIASMPANVFTQTLASHPEVAGAVMRHLTRLVRRLSDRVFEISTLAVRNRIHAELLRLARRNMDDDNTARISPAPTHADIASRVSTHREAVTREFNALTRAGLIGRKSGAIVIRDVAALARMVEEVLGE